MQQYPSNFDSVDTIKLKILLHFERSLGIDMNLSLQNSELLINDKTLDCIHLNDIPMYANSKAIRDLREEALDLEKEIVALLEANGNKRNEICLRKERLLERARKSLLAFENQLMAAARTVAAFMSSDQALTERTKKAMLLLDEGNPEEALAVLDDELRRKELLLATEKADKALSESAKALDEVQKLVKEALIKIEALRMQIMTSEHANEMICLYREAEASIIKYDFDREPLIDFAVFLREQNRLDEALQEAESLYSYYRNKFQASPRQRAKVCDILGRLYYLGAGDQFANAENLYLEAIKLSEETNDLAEISFICVNLGYFYKASCRFEEAKAVFKRSCEIRKQLCEEDSVYRSSYAFSMNSLADVYAETGEYTYAIELYLKALEIRKEIAKKVPNEQSRVARTCYNLSYVYLKENNFSLARQYAEQALEIRRRLCDINPEVHSGFAAQSCINLTDVYIASGENLQEAHTILHDCENFLDSCQDAFLLEHKADFFHSQGMLADAEGYPSAEFYKKALEFRREREKKTPGRNVDSNRGRLFISCTFFDQIREIQASSSSFV
ncbi:MAG: tetratricopeptide repeat protein [Clostridia bacterium]|nr:tetratricopeptide repeat protein [Clostridia bacterium]